MEVSIKPVPRASQSLQRKFAFIAGGLLILTSAVFLILVTQGYRHRILTAHERASMSVNLLLQAALENAMIKRDLEGLQGIVTRLGAQNGIDSVRIVNPSGEVRFSSDPDQLFRPFADPDFAQALSEQEQQAGFRTLPTGREVLRSINPVHNQGACYECHGSIDDNPVNGLLVVDYMPSSVRRDARNGAIILGVLGITVLLTIEAGLWLALKRLVIEPLDELDQTTRRLASGDLSVRANAESDDEIGALGSAFNDMAEQLQASVNELQTSEAFLQALIDAVPDGVRVIDKDYNVLMVNRAYCGQLDVKREDAVGTPCFASSHGRKTRCVPTMVRCPVNEILYGDLEQLKCDHVHKTRDGAEFPVEVFAAPVELRVNGETVPCVVESVRDLQTQINISQEQRLAEMGMLAAGVAHEVNNPLSSIGLALRAIGAEPGQSEKAKRYVAIAETEIANCKKFSDSLLRLAAPSLNATELVDMAEVVSDTASLLEFEATHKRITIKTDIQGAPRVQSKDNDMRVLVFNLLLNAIHAMPNGGEAVVRLSSTNDSILLQIQDEGVGIAERDRDKVLMPFWTKRADGTRGRGLGLSICNTIVKKLGGTINFVSEVGVGTTFHITLPNGDRAGT